MGPFWAELLHISQETCFKMSSNFNQMCIVFRYGEFSCGITKTLKEINREAGLETYTEILSVC